MIADFIFVVAMFRPIPQPLADLDRPSMCAVERVILRTVEPATDPGIWTPTPTAERHQ